MLFFGEDCDVAFAKGEGRFDGFEETFFITGGDFNAVLDDVELVGERGVMWLIGADDLSLVEDAGVALCVE